MLFSFWVFQYFLMFLLLLSFSFIALWSDSIQRVISVSYICWDLHCDLRYGLFWTAWFFCRRVLRSVPQGAGMWPTGCQPLLPARQAWELKLSFLFYHISLGSLLVSAPCQFLQGDQTCVIFPSLCLDIPTQAGWAQHSTPPHQVEVKISLPFIRPYFCPGSVQFAHMLHSTLQFPAEQMVWCTDLQGLKFHLVVRGISLDLHRQEEVRGSMFTKFWVPDACRTLHL
jgi:hypothetical protein